MPRRPGARAEIVPATLPTVWLARDWPPTTVAARVRSGTWERAGRGVLLDASTTADPYERRRDLALARAIGVHTAASSDRWFSHQTAALLWGLPLWTAPRATHLLSPHRAGGGRPASLRIHTGPMSDDELTCVNGLPVTSLARTVADCLATLPPLEGLVVADAALHRKVPADDVLRAIQLRGRTNGYIRAAALLSLADDGAESPGESATRYQLLRAGLPVPTTQIPVSTRVGTVWGDLGWDGWRVLLEYDGRDKYVTREDLVAEKRRHDAVVETGRRVLRVTHQDMGSAVARVVPLLPATVTRNLRRRPELAA